MHKITGLWRQVSKNGITYYTGKVGNTRVMVFKNEKRPDHDKDPDLTLMAAKVDEQQGWSELLPAEAGKSSAPAEPKAQPKESFEDLDDEIPF